MTFLLKGVTVVATTVGIGGVGLVGSNYAFPKSEIVAIEPTDNKEWENKLLELADELKKTSNNGLAAKIDSAHHSTTLSFVETPANSKEFKNKTSARDALKAWCIRTDAQEAELKDKLCKKEVKKGWLFGNDV
ncbi:hypothetical protein A6V39_04690 [Candidatus Mycoplasma haematobovis]|uniref:Uncharacterized protein n=1 Tax=Candidatus Mycoplasma haematobovis TaxID=432608 RepID=A0A1A9QC82_9MOLU|nr:hypothetical protein [Candidatus Mycoplasma haematobovis]OAL09848.1 hypothetical protein A6V39_04690 [Candidatus Mycoplasma haematobovis]